MKTTDPCHEMRLLVQADADGELRAAEAARVAAHLETCASCAGLQSRLVALSGDLRHALPKYRTPDHLRKAVRKQLPSHGLSHLMPPRSWSKGLASAVVAVAASLALLMILPARGPDGLPDWVVAAHVRALQPQHLLDVVSTEQHTVKPWFAGRLSFSPPVLDLTAKGFPLIGARLDSLPGSEAAVLVYKRREHVINLFIWPSLAKEEPAVAGSRDGYNFVHWAAGNMMFWAVSDLNARELTEFADRWR
jgi:anti-sigma factor RsiW